MKLLPTLALAALAASSLAAGAKEPADDPASSSPGKTRSCATCPELDLDELVARFATRTGKQFIIDPRVRAQVPLIGMDPNNLGWDQLLAILAVHQFAAVEENDWIVIVPDAIARQLATPVYTDRKFKAPADQLV